MGKELAYLHIRYGPGTTLLHSILTAALENGWYYPFYRNWNEAQGGSFVRSCTVRTRQDWGRTQSGRSDARAPALSALPCCLLPFANPKWTWVFEPWIFLKLDQASVSHSPRIQRKRICNRLVNTICTKKCHSNLYKVHWLNSFLQTRALLIIKKRQRSRKTAIILINSLKWKYAK